MLDHFNTVPARARTDLAGRIVLVLTGDFYEGRNIRYVLQRAGAKVIGPVHDVASALRAIASRALNCAIIDAAFGVEDHHRVASALFDKQVLFISLAAPRSIRLPDHLAAAPWMARPADCRALPGLILSMTRPQPGNSMP